MTLFLSFLLLPLLFPIETGGGSSRICSTGKEERRGEARRGWGWGLGFGAALGRGGREERKKKACLVGRWFGSITGPAGPGCYRAGKALFFFAYI